MVAAMLLGGLRRCEVLGLRLEDVRAPERRLFIANGKGGHQRFVPISGRFFEHLSAYLEQERPADADTDAVFLVLKRPRRGRALSADGLDEVLDGARGRAGLTHASCHELRHTCLTRLREAGMALEAVQAQAGHVSIESTRIYLHLADDWLASQYCRAAEVIDAQVFAGLPGATTDTTTGSTRRTAGADPGLPEAAMSGPLLLPRWEQLQLTHPKVVATMRTYLAQVACVLRPGSVDGADLALRSFTAYLAAEHPALRQVRDVGRPQVEGFKTWFAARPGQNKARVTPATIAHRLGTLRVFFTRIDEWGWDEAPPRVPMFLGDVP